MKRMNLALKKLIITAIALSSLSCAATEENTSHSGCKNQNPNELFSDYVIFDASRYGGGLTSESVAKGHIGETASIDRNRFKVRDLVISNPSYKVSCYSSSKEGEVNANRWSNFYGFGLDRKSIKVLHVYNPKEDASEPYVNLEVVNGQLWEMYDGWLYKMKTREASGRN